MNKAQVYAEYAVDEHGTIRSPGKFETESWIAPIVYDWYLDGDPGEMVGDINLYVVDQVTASELELDTDDFALALSESDQGFVSVWTLTKAEYDAAFELEEDDGED